MAQFGNGGGRHARPLSAEELAKARPIFGTSIDYSAVRVIRADFFNAPTTLGNWIRIKNAKQFTDAILVHELTHIWQYQTQGTRYMSDALCSQISAIVETGDRNNAYDMTTEQLANVHSFYDLTVERQARVVEFYYVSALMRDPKAENRTVGRRLAYYAGLSNKMTDPNGDTKKFEAEFAELERLVGVIKLAHPIGTTNIYVESLGVPTQRAFPIERPDEVHVMPVFRVDF